MIYKSGKAGERKRLKIFAVAISAAPVASSGISGLIPWAAVVAGLVSLFGLALARLNERRDRRRTLYSEAYKAALAWVEMLYRVRRRDPERPYELAAQFHKLQEDIDFYQGWIESESIAFGRAYQRLVLEVKALTLPDIQAAWATGPVDPQHGFSLQGDTHPPVESAKQQFLRDLRAHLSLKPADRWALRSRYSDQNWQRVRAAIPKPPATPLEGSR
jgi:hypothetical protein